MNRKTNTEFVTELMEFSQHGALMQLFVIQALDVFAAQVIAQKDSLPEHGMINRDAWIGCAEEVQRKINAQYEFASKEPS